MCGATSLRKQQKAARPSVPHPEWHLAVPAVEELPVATTEPLEGIQRNYFKIISDYLNNLK